VQFVGPAGHGGDATIDEALHLAQQLADSIELARIGLSDDHPADGPNGSNHGIIARAWGFSRLRWAALIVDRYEHVFDFA
jgi:hypothetical protein